MLISQTRIPHIPPAPPTKRVAMTEAELIAAMSADALEIKRRTASMQMRDTVQDEVPEETILSFVAQNPGCTAHDIARAIGRHQTNIRSRMSSMENRGQVKVRKIKKDSTWMRVFYPVTNPPKARNGRPPKPKASPQRDKVINFIRTNPGCTTPELAKHMNCSNKMASAHISEVRKVIKIKSVRSGRGNHIPAKHWIDE